MITTESEQLANEERRNRRRRSEDLSPLGPHRDVVSYTEDSEAGLSTLRKEL